MEWAADPPGLAVPLTFRPSGKRHKAATEIAVRFGAQRALLPLAPLKAQLDRGQIAGPIQDSSFAAVGKATVTAVGVQGVAAARGPFCR